MKPISVKERDQLVDLFRQRLPVSEIMERTGRSPVTILDLRRATKGEWA